MSPSHARGPGPVAWVIATILLLAAVAGSLWVPLYARVTPKLGAFPFFYWYQLLLVPAVAIVSWIAHLLLRRVRSRHPPVAYARRSPGDAASADQDGQR